MKKIFAIIILCVLIAAAVILIFSPQTEETDNLLSGYLFKPRVVASHGTTTSSVETSNGTINFIVPKDYTVSLTSHSFFHPRFMALSPDNRLFVTDFLATPDSELGRVYVLDHFDLRSDTFASTTIYLDNLRNPNSIAFYKDSGSQWWIYIAETHRLMRFKYTYGDMKPEGEPELVATFPDYGKSATQGGWHLTRTLAIHNDKIYVSVGSSCNSCVEKSDEWQRATIVEMDPDGKNQKIFASGLRNAVGIDWLGDRLYATDMGVDHLGADKPNDLFYKIAPGTNYGWPYCYQSNGAVYEDTTIAATSTVSCASVPPADVEFEPHAAPLGFAYVNKSFLDTSAKNSFLVALHGSGNPAIGTGNKIVRVSSIGVVTDFITGFHDEHGTRFARPADILMYDNRSFFFTDDYRGNLFYVHLK